MEQILEVLADGLIELRGKVSTSLEDIAKINAVLEELQSNQLNKNDIEKLVILLATGYFKTKNDDYDTMINDLMVKIAADNEAQVNTLINQSIEAIKSDLTVFKSTIKNGINGLRGTDGLDGKNGRNGLSGRDGKDGKDGQSIKGEKGKDGFDGVGVVDIKYKNGILTVDLSDNTKRDIKFNIPTMLGGGGGVSSDYVQRAITDAMNGGSVAIDAYTKEETDNLLLEKANKTDVYTIEEIDNQQNLFIQDTQPTQTDEEGNETVTTDWDEEATAKAFKEHKC